MTLDPKGLEAGAQALERMYRGDDLEVQPFGLMAKAVITAYFANSKPERLFRHKKQGTEYVLLGIGKMQAMEWVELRPLTLSRVDSIDMHEVAIYRSVDDGSLWVRPREEFEDGRFEEIKP